MTITLSRIVSAQRPILDRMFQLYLYDMSEFTGWPVTEDGVFDHPPDLLPPYWDQPHHHPYFIKIGPEIAGFCLVRRAPDNTAMWDMGQFFVLRKFRGQGIGRLTFLAALERHPGPWQVRVLPDNTPAYRFWKTCARAGPNDQVTESRALYNGVEMVFFSVRNNG